MGVVGFGYGIFEPMQAGHHFGLDDIAAISLGFLLVLVGLITVAVSEVVGVLFAIENNTRNPQTPIEEVPGLVK